MDFLRRCITMDKSWSLYHTPESNLQSVMWAVAGEHRLDRPTTVRLLEALPNVQTYDMTLTFDNVNDNLPVAPSFVKRQKLISILMLLNIFHDRLIISIQFPKLKLFYLMFYIYFLTSHINKTSLENCFPTVSNM